MLDGAKALAIPTKYGQSLSIETNTSKTIEWKSFNELGEIWFEDVLHLSDLIANKREVILPQSGNAITNRLIQILKSAQLLNPEFLNSEQGYNVSTHQDFNRLWGLGTSSTLINNIADWATINPYKLLELTFGGSGYDIACARHHNPITYQLTDKIHPIIETVTFDPSFKNNLYFVYLNQKQDSRSGITNYRKLNNIDPTILQKINHLTFGFINCISLEAFEALLTEHEQIISDLIQQNPIKSQLFNDYTGSIKSLGAWGGDFVLATSKTDPTDYFRSKGYNTIIPYSNMVLN